MFDTSHYLECSIKGFGDLTFPLNWHAKAGQVNGDLPGSNICKRLRKSNITALLRLLDYTPIYLIAYTETTPRSLINSLPPDTTGYAHAFAWPRSGAPAGVKRPSSL